MQSHLVNRLDQVFYGLLSGSLSSVDEEVFLETERSYFKDNELYLRQFLGVLYYFREEYGLSYALLKEESDEVSRFYTLASMIDMGYTKEARALFDGFKDKRILSNVRVSSMQRIRVGFLLGLDRFPECKPSDPLSIALYSMLKKDKKANATQISSAIYGNHDHLIVSEYRRRMELGCSLIQPLDFSNHFFSDDFLKVWSFSKNIGNNMTLLSIGGHYFIVDCGADVEERLTDFDGFFRGCGVNPDAIEGVFFTHAHLDHVGNALSLLHFLGGRTTYYLTETTRILAGNGNQIFFDLNDEFLTIVDCNQSCEIAPGLSVTFLANGHILGSYSLLFKYGVKQILFTSDFCLHDQETIRGMDLANVGSFVGESLDYLIIESTYGNNVTSIEYGSSKQIFLQLIKKLRFYGKKVFLPAYAIGRSQEILNLIHNCENLNDCSVNVLGMANNVSLYYQNIGKCPLDFYCDDYDVFNYDLVISSSGMLVPESKSHEILLELINSPRDDLAIVQTGYLPPNGVGQQLVSRWKANGGMFFEIGLSAHASNRELHRVISYFSPNKIITIHGDGIL